MSTVVKETFKSIYGDQYQLVVEERKRYQVLRNDQLLYVTEDKEQADEKFQTIKTHLDEKKPTHL